MLNSTWGGDDTADSLLVSFSMNWESVFSVRSVIN